MKVVLALREQQDSLPFRRILLGEGLTCSAEHVAVYDALPAQLAATHPDLVLIVCDGTDESLAAIRAAVQVTNVPVFVTGPADDARRLRAALQAGAREYLSQLRLREELTEALVKIGLEEASPDQPGRILALFSPSGGAGVSHTAVNLAVRLGRHAPENVALVDLKPAPSDLAMFMDIQPERTLNDVLQNWDRLDRQMIKAAMTKHRTGVHVLPQETYPDNGSMPDDFVTRRGVRQLLVLLRRLYRTTLLDLDHTLSEPQLEAMKLADFVALVVRPDVPGVRRAAWALDAAAAAGLPRDRFRLVLNRYGASGSIKLTQIEDSLGVRVLQTIPEDRAIVTKAINRGVTVNELSRFARISRSFGALARNVENFGA